MAFLRAMHMFQLNGYKTRVHLKWLLKNSKKLWSQLLMLLLLTALLSLLHFNGGFFNNSVLKCIVISILALMCALPFINRPAKNVKKSLVYTPRVIRMLITGGILLLAQAVWYFLNDDFGNDFGRSSLYIFTCAYILSPFMPILVNLINSPVESAVRKSFIKDAKKILRSCRKNGLQTIGITGSYGKTSVKYYLTELLRGRFETLMTPESYNTPMGICKTIRGSLRGTHEIFVCEMGLSHVGDIQELCDFIEPEHGIITAIGDQHLATMKTREAIRNEKLALARAVTGGLLFVNGDSIKHDRPENSVSYGLDKDNGCRAYDIGVTLNGTVFSVNLQGKIIENLRTPLIGSHNVCNLVAAIAMASALGVSEADIRARLKRLNPPPHRLELRRAGNVAIIDDAFNSNPAGAKAALDTLSLFEGCKIIITPGMVELGSAQYDANFALGKLSAAVCDYVIAVGENQAPPILAGLKDAGYPEEKIFTALSFKEAIDKAYSLPFAGEKIILLENDLPDNY